jgi:hypothetical protein
LCTDSRQEISAIEAQGWNASGKEAVMRCILVVDDDPHVGLATRAPSVPLIAICGYAFSSLEIAGTDVLGMAARLGATRCLRTPVRPTTLLNVIDQCLSEVEPHREYVATLSAVAKTISEQHRDALRG